MGLCLQDPFTHQVHPLVLCLLAFSELIGHMTVGVALPGSPGLPLTHCQKGSSELRLRKGESQSCGLAVPTGSGSCAEVEVGQTRRRAGWHGGRWQVAELSLCWGWSKAVNRFGGSGSA